jgi:hypothetical protein
MYKTISDILIPNTLKKANEWALKERSNYKQYGEIVEEYAQTHNLIAGEQTGIDLMLGRPFHKDSYPYIFYSKDPEKAGYDIADNIYSQTSYPYVSAISQLDGAEVQVKIADRQMVNLIHLDEYKGVDMIQLTDPIVHEGWFNKHISCININVQLARIYRQLSSPSYVDIWDVLLKDESQMINVINSISLGGDDTKTEEADNTKTKEFDNTKTKEFDNTKTKEFDNTKTEEINNTKTEEEDEDEDEEDEDDDEYIINTYSCDVYGSHEKYFDPRDNIIEKLKHIVKEYNCVIISERNKKIQITGMDDIVLENLLKKDFPGQINKIIQLPKIPGEERMKRYTYYYSTVEKKYPLIDLFNIAEYDPIPQKNGYAHVLVMLRIIVVDIWTLKLIKALGQINEQFADKRILELNNEFIKLRGTEELNLDVLHNGYTYIGTMDKDRYSKSKIIRKMRSQSEIYFPYNNQTGGGGENIYTPAKKDVKIAPIIKQITTPKFIKFPSSNIVGGCKFNETYGLYV